MIKELFKFFAALTVILFAGFLASVVWATLPLIIGFPIGLVICAFLGVFVSRVIYGIR